MSWSKEEKLAFVANADKSLIHFALAFFPDAFYDDFSPDIHYEIARVIDAPVPRSRQKAIAAPRNAGKSTLGNTVNIIRRLLMGRSRYPLIISNTGEQAEDHLRVIKQQLTQNERLLEVFGLQKGDIWRDDAIVLRNGAKAEAVGSGMQVRGSREGFGRPDYFLLDDFESRESVDSETILSRITSWWASDLRNSGDRHRWEELMLGTILSDRAILNMQLENPECLSVRLELFDGNYKSKWPQVKSDADIELMRAQAEREGKLNELWADFRNIAVAGETQKFRLEWMKDWTPAQGDFGPEGWMRMPRILIVDPARTVTRTSDFSAICAVGMPRHGEIFLLDYDNDRMVNEALYDQILVMVRRWNIKWIYVETNGLNDYVTAPLQKFLIRNGWPANVEDIHRPGTKGAKDDSIFSMIPLFKMGQIWLPPGKSGPVKDQFLRHPHSKFDDIADCFSYAVQIQTKLHIGRNPTPGSVYKGNKRIMQGRAAV